MQLGYGLFVGSEVVAEANHFPIRHTGPMGWWVGLGLLVWVVVAIAIAVLVGRVISRAAREDEPRMPSTPPPLSLENPDEPAA